MSTATFAYLSTDPAQTDALGRALAGLLRPGDVLCLDGPLGAGKTAFVRGIASGLGLDERAVSSPTFVIMNRYSQPARGVAPHASTPLIHVDAYRIAGMEDLVSAGFDAAADGSSVIAIEWASRLGGQVGMDSATVALSPAGESARRIDLSLPGHWLDRRGGERFLALVRPGQCPVCGKAVAPGVAPAPFCSERCRGADLGAWLTGRYVVSRDLEPGDAPK